MAKLVASPGDVLCSSEPYVYILYETEAGRFCDFCLSPGQLLKCSACQLAWYCNKSCQKKGWKYHQEECKGHRRMAPRVVDDDTRLILRLILRLKCDPDVSEEAFGQKRTFKDLMSHKEEIIKDPVRSEEFVQQCLSLREFVGKDFVLPDDDELLEIFGKLCINSFGISDKVKNQIGSGLFLGPSLLDHSCSPNAVVLYYGRQLNIICVEPIYEGQKVTISYIDLLHTTADRRELLKRDYYFQCQCDLCLNEERDAQIQSFSCTGTCSGPVIRSKDGDSLGCKLCERHDFDDEYRRKTTDAVKECHTVLQKLKDLNSENKFEELMQVSETCIENVGTILHPSNVQRVKLVDMLFDACSEVENFEKAVHYGIELIELNRYHYSNFYPDRGLHLMKVGQIQLFLEKVADALESLQQADEIIRVTYGPHHELYADLQDLLNQCHMKQSCVQS